MKKMEKRQKKAYFKARTLAIIALVILTVINLSTFSSAFNWTDGIVSYHAFEQTSGRIFDDSYSGKDADNVGATRGVTGKIGNAINTTTGYVVNISRVEYGNFSIQGWYYLSNYSSGTLWLFSQRDTVTGTPIGPDLGIANLSEVHKLSYSIRGNGGSLLEKRWDTSSELNTWYHMVATYEKTGTHTGNMTLYVNGTPVTSAPYGGGSWSDTTRYSIGVNAYQLDTAGLWQGIIDEIGIWNRVLNHSEVLELYNSGSGLASNFTAPPPNYTYGAESYVNESLSGTAHTITINVTMNNATLNLSTATLTYNNTNYTGTVTAAGGSIFNAAATLNSPTVTNDTGIDFFWNLAFTNGETNITPTRNHTVVLGSMSAVDTTYNLTFINFTIYDVEKRTALNAEFLGSFDYSTVGTSRTYSYSNTSETNNTFRFGFLPFYGSFTVNGTLTYEATGYSKNYYYLENANITNQTQEIKLYLLNSSLSTLTTLHAQDQYENDLENVIIQIQRYDVGTDTYELFGMAKTNFEGDDIAYLNWYDTFYRFIVIQDGEVKFSTSPTKISATPLTFTVYDDTTFVYDEFTGVSYTLVYNNNTNNFVLTYADASGSISSGCLRVIRRTALSDTTLNDTCVDSASGTLYYNTGVNATGDYYATFYAKGSPFYVFGTIYKKLADIDKSILEAVESVDATMYSIIGAGVVTFLGLFSAGAAVVMMLVGLVVASTMGWLLLDVVTFVGLVIIGLVIIWSIKR